MIRRSGWLVCAAALALTPFSLAGCASLMASKTAEVSANSDPPGADVYVDGARVGTAPLKTKVEQKRSHTFSFRLAGYRESSCSLEPRTGGSWVILDVLFGLVPIIVDAATNDWTQLGNRLCAVRLEPDPTAMPAAPIVQTSAPTPATMSTQQVLASVPRPTAVPAPDPMQTPVSAQAQRANAVVPAPSPDGLDPAHYQARQIAMDDIIRLELAADVLELRPGLVRVVVGEAFYREPSGGAVRRAPDGSPLPSSGSDNREAYFRRLASAYEAPVIELWARGQKFGEFIDGRFLVGPEFSAPR